jgi:hypothetical protein
MKPFVNNTVLNSFDDLKGFVLCSNFPNTDLYLFNKEDLEQGATPFYGINDLPEEILKQYKEDKINTVSTFEFVKEYDHSKEKSFSLLKINKVLKETNHKKLLNESEINFILEYNRFNEPSGNTEQGIYYGVVVINKTDCFIISVSDCELDCCGNYDLAYKKYDIKGFDLNKILKETK